MEYYDDWFFAEVSFAELKEKKGRAEVSHAEGKVFDAGTRPARQFGVVMLKLGRLGISVVFYG